MSTQRRVVRWQRPYITELAGTGDSLSLDGGVSVSRVPFRCATDGQTASLTGASFHWTRDGREWATNSLSFSSCCSWVQQNSPGCFLLDEVEQNDRFISGHRGNAGWTSFPTASPRAFLAFSPPTGRFRAFRPIDAVGLAAAPNGVCRGTERQHGQGNLYFEHAA